MQSNRTDAPPFADISTMRAFLYANRGSSFIAYADGIHVYTVLAPGFRGYEARFDGGPAWRYHLDGRIEQVAS